MVAVTVILGVFFSILSAAILAYLSISTMVGPWVAPLIVLLSSTFFKLFTTRQSKTSPINKIVAIQAIGAGGGAIATGIGFALPMLYFLDRTTFIHWMQEPFYFCLLLGILSIAAGAFGIWLARLFADRFIHKNKFPFPASQLTYNVIIAQNQHSLAKRVFKGIAGTSIVCLLRDGIFSWSGIIPKALCIFPSLFGHELAFAITPTFWALGFTIGLSIAMPLLIGTISKYLILYPLNNHANYLPFQLFQPLDHHAFTVAFCCGLIVSEIALSLIHHPHFYLEYMRKYLRFLKIVYARCQRYCRLFHHPRAATSSSAPSATIIDYLEISFAVVTSCCFLSFFGFSLPAQITLLALTAIATYHITLISGKIGLVQYGRFATYVMLPMLFLFKLNFIQATIVCVFFNICAATASDLLFDYKIGQFCMYEKKRMHLYQWIGLIAAAASIGIFLWLLFTNFEIGSADLIAQRGRNKALLLQTLNFNKYVIGMGFIYGYLLKKLRLSPAMVFGGLIMPNSLTFGLVIGGLLSLVARQKEDFLPFCSGVFAYESVWIIMRLIL